MTKPEAEALLAWQEQESAEANDATAFALSVANNRPHREKVRHILRLWADAKRCRLAGLIHSACTFEAQAETEIESAEYSW